MKKKGSYNWFEELEINHQLQIFKRWRMITTNTKKHLCLDEIKQNKKDVMIMIKELSTSFAGKKDLSNLNDLDRSWCSKYHF